MMDCLHILGSTICVFLTFCQQCVCFNLSLLLQVILKKLKSNILCEIIRMTCSKEQHKTNIHIGDIEIGFDVQELKSQMAITNISMLFEYRNKCMYVWFPKLESSIWFYSSSAQYRFLPRPHCCCCPSKQYIATCDFFMHQSIGLNSNLMVYHLKKKLKKKCVSDAAAHPLCTRFENHCCVLVHYFLENMC